MSYSKETTIWCDSIDCNEWESSADTAAVLRKYLARHGWTHEGTRDYCRDCSEGA